MSYGPYSCTGGGTAGAVQTTDPAAAIQALTSGTWDGGGLTYYTAGIVVTHPITVQNATIYNSGWQGTPSSVSGATLTFAALPDCIKTGQLCQGPGITGTATIAVSGNVVTLTGTLGALSATGSYKFASSVQNNGKLNFNATLEFDNVTSGTAQNLTLAGFYPNDGKFYSGLAACEALNFKSCTYMAISNVLALNNFSDGFTFNFYGLGSGPSTGFTVNNIAAVNCGREGITPQSFTNSVLNNVYISNPTHNAIDFESDVTGIGAGGLTFNNFTADAGGIQFIEAILGDISFTNVAGQGRITLNNTNPVQHTISFANGTWAFPSYTGSTACINMTGGTLTFDNITCSRQPGNVNLPAWSAVAGAVTNRKVATIRQGYSYNIQSGTPQTGKTPSTGTGFDGSSASVVHVQSIPFLPDPSSGAVLLTILDYTGSTTLGQITYTSITGSVVGNHDLNTINGVSYVSGSGTTVAGTGTTTSPQLQFSGATVAATLAFNTCTFEPSMLSVPGTHDSSSTVTLTGCTNLAGGGPPTWDNDYTGLPLATGQLPIGGVPTYGGVQLPSGSVNGVVVICHGILEGTTPGQALPFYQTFCAESMAGLANDLVADGWAALWPSYPTEGLGNTANITSIINDLSSATSNSGAQLLNTNLKWWELVIRYCHLQWPGQKIAFAGWSQGAYMALQAASHHPEYFIGGIAHEPATIWANAVAPPYTFPAATTYDLGTTALNASNIPIMVGYGTADTTVGYNLAGTGGTPISNTSAIISNAIGAGMPVTANATGDGHHFEAADRTTYHTYFTTYINGLR